MRHDTTERQQLKEALQARIKNLAAGSAAPGVVMRAETRWLGNLLCEASSRDLPAVRADEPRVMGGDNTAMNPMELVLAALGMCQEIVYSAYAALMDIPLDAVHVSLSGQLDLREMFDLQHEAGAGFSKIRFETRLQSPANEAEIRKLVETVERCCPVLDTLARPVSVTGHVLLNDKPLK
jgi:uncharacterized OsmC-like protein